MNEYGNSGLGMGTDGRAEAYSDIETQNLLRLTKWLLCDCVTLVRAREIKKKGLGLAIE